MKKSQAETLKRQGARSAQDSKDPEKQVLAVAGMLRVQVNKRK